MGATLAAGMLHERYIKLPAAAAAPGTGGSYCLISGPVPLGGKVTHVRFPAVSRRF